MKEKYIFAKDLGRASGEHRNPFHEETIGGHWDKLRRMCITNSQTAWLRKCSYNMGNNEWSVPMLPHDMIWDYLHRENVPELLHRASLGALKQNPTASCIFRNHL